MLNDKVLSDNKNYPVHPQADKTEPLKCQTSENSLRYGEGGSLSL